MQAGDAALYHLSVTVFHGFLSYEELPLFDDLAQLGPQLGAALLQC
ncbi:hypothetical protein [Streptomyces sp. NPDC057616]